MHATPGAWRGLGVRKIFTLTRRVGAAQAAAASGIPVDAAHFYVGCALDVLGYLHERHILCACAGGVLAVACVCERGVCGVRARAAAGTAT